MKLLRVENDRYVFHLNKQEKFLLTVILRLYPVLPPAHQSLSKNAAVEKANQRLLDEALAEQRNENKKLVEALLADKTRFQVSEDSARMILSAGDVEWLLQVLNDVRVGNWVLLGSPENELPQLDPKDPKAPRAGAMELAAYFQMALLAAIDKHS